MVRLIILCITMLIILSATLALGAEWSVGWSGEDRRLEQLTMTDDKDYQFKMDRFLCKASKITLEKIKDEIFERRYLSCQIDKDTYVSTDLAYNIKSTTCLDTRSLIIHDKDKLYMAHLFVMCK